MKLFMIYQGKIYNYEVTQKDNKYIFNTDNVLNLLSITESRLDKQHGKGLVAYVVSKDVDKAIDVYEKYMTNKRKELLQDLKLYESYLNIDSF